MALFDVHHKAFKAFTLAELLMAVLVISIVMVALAPVITKRVSENLNITTNTQSKGEKIYIAPGDYEFVVPEGINVLHIKGAGGGGAGGYKSETPITTKTFTPGNRSWAVPTRVSKIEYAIKGAGGAGGKSSSTKTSETCNGVVIPRIGKTNGYDMCVQRDSVKSSGGHIPVGYSQMYQGSTQCYSPAKSCYVDSNMFQYCPAAYADDFCSKMVGSEWYSFQQNGSDIIHDLNMYNPTTLIDNLVPYGYRPKSIEYACYNNSTGQQFVVGINTIWCGNMGVYPEFYGMNSGSVFDWDSDSTPNLRQVRCAKDFREYVNYSGSGGCSSAVLEGTLNVNMGDKLEMKIAQPSSYSGSSTDYYTYYASHIVLYDSNNVFIDGLKVAGAKNGIPATSSANGALPIPHDYNCFKCQNSTCSSTVNTTCSMDSYCGKPPSGSITDGTGYGPYGDLGGKGGYNYTDWPEPDKWYTAAQFDAAKGQNATRAGTGGGGGYGPSWARGQVFSNGKGGGGEVVLSYKINIPGGGGGGGAVVDGKGPDGKAYELKLKVTPGDKLKIHVGKGGTATVSSSGMGESSSIMAYTSPTSTAARISFGGGSAGGTSISESTAASGGNGGTMSIPYPSYVKFSHSGVSAASFKGANGYAAKSAGTMLAPVMGYEDQYAFQNNGIEGGMGAGCGGQLQWSVQTGAMGQNNYFEQFAYGGGLIPNRNSSLGMWVSDTEKQDGQNGAAYLEQYNTTFNQYCGGGRGGGGAGSFSSKGGSGSDGYVVIRWDSKENEF